MIFMASKFSYFIRTLRVVFSVWKKVVDKTYWNATAKTNILGFALLVQHAKIGVISFLKVKNYKPVPIHSCCEIDLQVLMHKKN